MRTNVHWAKYQAWGSGSIFTDYRIWMFTANLWNSVFILTAGEEKEGWRGKWFVQVSQVARWRESTQMFRASSKVRALSTVPLCFPKLSASPARQGLDLCRLPSEWRWRGPWSVDKAQVLSVLRVGRKVIFSERADQAVLWGGSALSLTLKILKSFHLEVPEARPVSIM